jgi:hypothetical protein
MFFKPLFEKTIRKKDLEATVAYTSQGEGAEPGFEAMVNQLLLDVGDGRLPDFLGQWPPARLPGTMGDVRSSDQSPPTPLEACLW